LGKALRLEFKSQVNVMESMHSGGKLLNGSGKH